MNHLIITPAHNEEAHLPGLIASMVAQDARPERWLIVNDRSEDRTRALVLEAAQTHPWISLLDYDGDATRALGSKVARIVLWALERAPQDWDYFSKLDADIVLPPDYYSEIFRRFSADSNLAIASGVCATVVGDSREIERVPRDHTRGAIKTYARHAWDSFGGFPPAHGWDGIDGLRAQRAGFRTEHFPELVTEHHRPTGAARGALRGRFVTGTFAHFLGYHPLFMAARSVRRMVDPPRVSGGVALFAGYLWAKARRDPVFDEPETVAFLRKKQLTRLGLGWLSERSSR
ncbi:MAG: glycosyltransferase family A protein [Myxococcota bacterium]